MKWARVLLCGFVMASAVSLTARQAAPPRFDIVVYGGTAGGVIAAVSPRWGQTRGQVLKSDSMETSVSTV